MVVTPDILNFQGRRNTRITEVSEFSNLRDLVTANGKIEFGSVANFLSNSGTSTAEPSKESNHEDKIEVPEFLSGGKFGSFAEASHMSPGFSTTTSLISFPTADSAMAPVGTIWSGSFINSFGIGFRTNHAIVTSLSICPIRKQVSVFFLPLHIYIWEQEPACGTVNSSICIQACKQVHYQLLLQHLPLQPCPLWHQQLYPLHNQKTGRIGTETQVRGEGPMEAPKGGSPTFPLGSAPFSHHFLPYHEVIFSTSLPTSSTSTISSLPSFGIVSGSQSNPFSSFKPLFGASTSVTKPSTIPSLTIEPSSVPFTFSPPPAPVSCSTPTFSVGSSSGAAPASITNAVEVSSSTLKSNVLDSTTVSVSVDSNSGPVFSFTSPSGGPKLPTSGTLETSLPLPTFTFGGASTMSNRAWTNVGQKSTTPILGQMFGAAGEMGSSTSSGLSFGSTSQIGSSTSSGLLFGLGTVSGGSMFSGASFSPGQSFGSGAGSMALPTPLTFGGQAVDSSPALFGSGSGSASGAELASSSAQSGLEFSTGLTSGEGGVEKTGRRFVRAKRKK